MAFRIFNVKWEQSPKWTKMSVKEEDIYKGEPQEILGFMRLEKTSYVLVKWTTGKAYVPYDEFKKHFPLMLMEYYTNNLRFKKLS